MARLGLVERAAVFARRAHAGQLRKYTGQPYIVHPASVAALVQEVDHTPAMVAAAWLHDVVEDCGVTVDELRRQFGNDVAALVESLTDQAPRLLGNRTVRKAWECHRLAEIDPRAKTVKLADLIDNTTSIVENDRRFARIYLREKEALLAALAGGDPTLMARAWQVLRASNDLLAADIAERKQ